MNESILIMRNFEKKKTEKVNLGTEFYKISYV